MRTLLWMVIAAMALSAPPFGMAAGRLQVEQAWIRTPPPGATMLAGYAVLHNVGDAKLVVSGANSEAFGDVSLHESVDDNGVEHMRALAQVELVPGAKAVFAPGGKHFMLMQPRQPLAPGQSVRIRLITTGGDVDAEFLVRDIAPSP